MSLFLSYLENKNNLSSVHKRDKRKPLQGQVEITVQVTVLKRLRAIQRPFSNIKNDVQEAAGERLGALFGHGFAWRNSRVQLRLTGRQGEGGTYRHIERLS